MNTYWWIIKIDKTWTVIWDEETWRANSKGWEKKGWKILQVTDDTGCNKYIKKHKLS